jgi:prolipoprotein diacylglyceryltransferase
VAFPTAPDGGQLMRHPVQIYESLFHLLGLVFLWLIERQNRFTGQRLKLYLLGYLVFRFLTETIRPEPVLYANLTAYQFACIGLAVALLAQFFWQQKRNQST